MNIDQLIRKWNDEFDSEAFEEIYRSTYPIVHRMSLSVAREPERAHDIAQATLLLLYQKRVKLKDEAMLMGWLWNTSRFIAKRMNRDDARRNRQELAALTPPAESEQEWMVLSALDKLREKDRQVLLLRYLQGLSVEEVSTICGIKLSATQMRISRALEELRKRSGITTAALLAIILSQTRAHAVSVPSWTLIRPGALAVAKSMGLWAAPTVILKVLLVRMVMGASAAAIIGGTGYVVWLRLHEPQIDAEKMRLFASKISGRYRGIIHWLGPGARELVTQDLVSVVRRASDPDRVEIREQQGTDKVNTHWFRFERGTNRVYTNGGIMTGQLTETGVNLTGRIQTDLDLNGMPTGPIRDATYVMRWTDTTLNIEVRAADESGSYNLLELTRVE